MIAPFDEGVLAYQKKRTDSPREESIIKEPFE